MYRILCKHLDSNLRLLGLHTPYTQSLGPKSGSCGSLIDQQALLHLPHIRQARRGNGKQIRIHL
jgi:hypothetical protein